MRFLMPLWQGVPERCFYQEFVAGICGALRELGHRVDHLPFKELGKVLPQESAELERLLQEARPDAVLDLACWGHGLTRLAARVADGRRLPVFEAYAIPHIALLYDQPFFQAINAIRTHELYAVYPDRGHPDQVRWAFPGLRLGSEIFAPPAVRAENDRSRGSTRDIDVLYVGNLDLLATERFWSASPGLDPALCDRLVQILQAEPDQALHRVVERAVGGRALPPAFNMCAHLRVVEIFRRHRFRRDAVLALARAGLRLRVVGREWDRIELPANVQLQSPTDYEGMFNLAASAKICLDVSTYTEGVNDRVFTYALNRAVCFTNAAGYLREAVGEDGGISFYSLGHLDRLVEEVHALLGRSAALTEQGELARETTLRAHTWRHRIERILAGIRPRAALG